MVQRGSMSEIVGEFRSFQFIIIMFIVVGKNLTEIEGRGNGGVECAVAVNVVEGERWAEEFRVRNEGVRTGILVLLYLHRLYGITYLTEQPYIQKLARTDKLYGRLVLLYVLRTCVRSNEQ